MIKIRIFSKFRLSFVLNFSKLINLQSNDKAEVKLEVSEDGISPGQACVFYNKDKLGYKVLGGGWIIN